MTINYIFNHEDSFVVENQDMPICFEDDSFFSYTFWKNRNKMPVPYSDQSLDLMYISLAVFAADRLTLRSSASDGWSRNIELYIPVLRDSLWHSVSPLLEEMLSFLSGDIWTLHFRKRYESDIEKQYTAKIAKSKMPVKEYDRVCMLSGGLDSFIGAIDLLERATGNTLFVSHYGGGKGTKEYQDALKQELIATYHLEGRDFHQYYAKVVGVKEDTTRTRSFMFFSHAIAVASSLGKPVNLIVPENGVISLNIPSTFSRIGTSSTRTTHPHYMALFQQLLNNLDIAVTLKNPYQFFTKGEMLLNCSNKVFLQSNLDKTMSCSHPDNGRMFKETEARHCGYCLPCVIRQAAIKRAGMHDISSYRDSHFTSGDTARMNLNSYNLGIKRFNPKYAFMSIQLSGSISDHIEEYASLYTRGMKELKDYLEEL